MKYLCSIETKSNQQNLPHFGLGACVTRGYFLLENGTLHPAAGLGSAPSCCAWLGLARLGSALPPRCADPPSPHSWCRHCRGDAAAPGGGTCRHRSWIFGALRQMRSKGKGVDGEEREGTASPLKWLRYLKCGLWAGQEKKGDN